MKAAPSPPKSLGQQVAALRDRLGLTRSRYFTPDLPSIGVRLAIVLCICAAVFQGYRLYQAWFGYEPYLLFGFGALVLSAWLGRLFGAVAATAVWLALVPYLFTDQLGPSALLVIGDPWAVTLCALEGAAVGLLVEGLHAARRQGLALAAERQTLAEDLLVERNRLDTLLANLPGLVWEMRYAPGEAQPRVVFVSANASRLSGYSAESWIGGDLFWKSLVPAETHDQFAAELQAAVHKGSHTFRHYWRHADGTLRAVETHLTAQPTRFGGYQELRGLSLDATALDTAERALAETERHFRTVSDRAPILIRLYRPDVGTIWCNRAWLELRGRTLEEECGTGWLDGVHPEDLARVTTALSEASEHLEEYRVDYRLRHADGSYRWVLSLGVPRTDGHGDYQDHLAFCFDIDDRKQLDLQREELLHATDLAREQAELATRSKDEFLAKVSHELRNPLNGILGWTQILRAPETTEEELRTGVVRIDSSARALSRLVDDLLDLSRILSGQFSLNLAPTRPGPILATAHEQLRPAAEARGVSLQLEGDEELPLVMGDSTRLLQIFSNILSNAVRFTPRGGTVRTHATSADGTLVVAITDDGAGIDPAFLPHAFTPFRQADGGSSRRHAGLGLGLSIVAQLVERHGGSVEAHSDGVGHGATFTVRLPLSPVQTPTQRDPRAPDVRLDDRQILVVDDDEIAREMLRTVLTRSGATVHEATSAEEALALISTTPLDVVISDLEMPGEDGLSLLRRVRALPSGSGGATPALALTAYARPEDRTAAFAAGFQAHLAKPVDTRALLSAIDRLTSR